MEQQEKQEPTATTTVTKRDKTKVKNPKRVEQGKRLSEHNRKMKSQIEKIQREVTQSNDANDSYWTYYLWAGVVVVVTGRLFYNYISNKFKQPQTISIAKDKPVPLDMELKKIKCYILNRDGY